MALLTDNDSASDIVIQIDLPEDSRHEERGRALFKNGIALLFALTNMILNFFVLAIIHERIDFKSKPLPDISFDILPKADWGLDVAEYIISLEVFSVFILLFLHRCRVIIFRRLCIVIGLLYFYRAICMISTPVPLIKTDYCAPQMAPGLPLGEKVAEIFSRAFHMLLGFGLSINGKHNYCGDYIYSGHTVILTFCYLTLREYLMPTRLRTKTWKLTNALVLSSSIAGVVFILIARGHYLVDVLLAYYVTTRTFWIFHHLIHNPSPSYGSTNYLSRVWWYRIIKYLDLDATE